MKIVVLTFGSRGDVQPYVALAKGLKANGHSVVVTADKSFKDLIIDNGLDFSPAGDYAASMKREMGRWLEIRFEDYKALQFCLWLRPFIPDLLNDWWNASRQADAIIYGPMALGGSHIAEKLGIPCVLAIVGPPLTPTAVFPSSYVPILLPLGKSFNWATHLIPLQAIWFPFMGQINRWRKNVLGLPPLGLLSPYEKRPIKEAVLYGYSPLLIPPAADWPGNVHVTGYWFPSRNDHWQAPEELLAFLENGPPPIYIGFGSMAPERSDTLTGMMLEALDRTRQRGVFISGWRDISRATMPDTVCTIPFAPHDWLFPKMAGIIHHGGAGTTAAVLRSGVPSAVVYFWKEQQYWGQKLVDIGVGARPMNYRHLTVSRIADTIAALTQDRNMQQKARDLGQKIRREDGTAEAVRIINHHIMDPGLQPGGVDG